MPPAPPPGSVSPIGGVASAPGAAESTPGRWGAPPPFATPGGIFGGDSGTTKPRTHLSNPATSPLNLIGKIEGWGIGPATKVVEVSIKVSSATGAQLKELLKKLPEGMTFELSLEKEDD